MHLIGFDISKKTMMNLVAGLLLSCFLTVLASTVAYAVDDEVDYQQLYTTQSIAGGVKITGFNMAYFNSLPKDDAGYTLVNLVIPAQIGGADVLEVAPWGVASNTFNNNKVKGTLTFETESKVQSIQENAFSNVYGNIQLTGDLILPDSISSVGSSAFYATGFKKIKLPQNPAYTTISFQCFMSVSADVLENGIPTSVTTIEGNAFRKSALSGELIVPDSVSVVSSSAFFDCDSLTKIFMTPNVKTIEKHTFADCDNLKEVVFPQSSLLETIATEAFRNSSIEKMEIPDSVTTIHYKAFNGCSSLKWFYVGAKNFICDGNNTNRLFFGSVSDYPNLHVICNSKEQADYIKDRVYNTQDRCVTYELTVNFEGDADHSDSRAVLYNFPLNYMKASNYATSKAWEVDEAYELPVEPMGKNAWSFLSGSSEAATEDSNVEGEMLYAIAAMPVVTATFAISEGDADSSGNNIQKVYDGKAAVYTVTGKLNGVEPKPLSELQPGDYFLGYNWYTYSQVGSNAPIMEGVNGNTSGALVYDNALSLTNVSESLSDAVLEERNPGEGYYYARYNVRVFLLRVNEGGGVELASLTPQATFRFEAIIAKATPEITFSKTAAAGVSLSSLASVKDNVEGSFEFNIEGTSCTVVQEGTNTYNYTFIPKDLANYNEVTGSIVITSEAVRVVSVGGFADISVNYGQALPALPDVVKVTMSDGSVKEVAVKWDTTSYNETATGAQTFKGTLVMQGADVNPDNLQASITVIVGEREEQPPVVPGKIEPAKTDSVIPQTSDSSLLWLFFALASASLGGMGLSLWSKKRNV